MADKEEKIYSVQGGYYPTGTMPESLSQYYPKWRDAPERKNHPDSAKTIEFLRPVAKDVPASQYIPARRASDKTKTGVETMDTGYDKETMNNLLSAYKTAHEKYGVPMLAPHQLTAMALEEGRSNFGYNNFNWDNPKAYKLQQSLIKQGYDPYAAGFPAAILDKQQLSARLNKPFFHVWNGDGVQAQHYNERVQNAIETGVPNNPKNQQLLQFIQNKTGYVAPPVQAKQPMQPQQTQLPADQQISQNTVDMPENFRAGGRTRLI